MDESPTPSEQSSKASKDSFVMIPRSQLEAWIEELASLREGLRGGRRQVIGRPSLVPLQPDDALG